MATHPLGKSQGQRNLVGCRPWGHKESGTTEWAPLMHCSKHFAQSNQFHGEGNGTLFQYSCLGNPWTEEPGGLQSMGLLRVGHD